MARLQPKSTIRCLPTAFNAISFSVQDTFYATFKQSYRNIFKSFVNVLIFYERLAF